LGKNEKPVNAEIHFRRFVSGSPKTRFRTYPATNARFVGEEVDFTFFPETSRIIGGLNQRHRNNVTAFLRAFISFL